MAKKSFGPRQAEITRQTLETKIRLNLNLDGGPIRLAVEPGFFQHMLNTLATYGGWGLTLSATGDHKVDHHHTVEDVGLVLGEALAQSLGDFSGHARYGSALVPMDEALAEAVLDAGRRPYLHFEVDWPQHSTGDFELCLIREFWRAVVLKSGWTLHLTVRRGLNSHHMAEALFKAAGLAAAQALSPHSGEILSTKGLL